MRIIQSSIFVLTCLGCIIGGAQTCSVQIEWIEDTGGYNVDEHWASEFVPDGEEARVSNGGTAIVDSAVPELSALRIGRLPHTGHGTLELRSGAERFVGREVQVGTPSDRNCSPLDFRDHLDKEEGRVRLPHRHRLLGALGSSSLTESSGGNGGVVPCVVDGL